MIKSGGYNYSGTANDRRGSGTVSVNHQRRGRDHRQPYDRSDHERALCRQEDPDHSRWDNRSNRNNGFSQWRDRGSSGTENHSYYSGDQRNHNNGVPSVGAVEEVGSLKIIHIIRVINAIVKIGFDRWSDQTKSERRKSFQSWGCSKSYLKLGACPQQKGPGYSRRSDSDETTGIILSALGVKEKEKTPSP